MRKLIIPLILSFLLADLHAQPVDVISTKSGDVYEGYISRQVPGKDLTIFSFKSTLTVSKHDVELARRHKEMLGDLPAEYQPLFPDLEGDSYVEIADVTVQKDNGKLLTFKNSILLEEGEDVKFTSFAKHPFDLKWSEIGLSDKVPYDFSQPTGIRDQFMLSDARVLEGQFLGQNLASGLMRFRTLDGSIMSFRRSEVQAVRFEPVDKDSEIWTQTPYCDRVILKNGMTLTGFIQSKVFGKYITFLSQGSDEAKEVSVYDIVTYEKFPNVLYEKPQIILPEEKLADLYLNGISYPVSQLLNKKSSFIVDTCVDSLKFVSKVGQNVVLKYKASARTSEVRLAKAKLKKEKVFGLYGVSFKKKRTELWPRFTSRDIMDGQWINIQSNDGEYIVADITFMEPGVYVLWIEGSDRCVPFNIKSY